MTDSSSGYIHMRVPGRYSTYSSWILIKFTSEVRWNWAGWGSRMVPLSTFALRYVSHCGSSLTVRLVMIMSCETIDTVKYTFRRLSSCDTANELSLHYIAWPSLSLGQEMLFNGRRFLKVAKELKFRAKVEKKVNDHVKEIRKKWDLEKKKKMGSKFPSSCELSSSGSGLHRMNASDHLKWSQSHHMTIVMMMFAWHKTFVFIMVHLCLSSSLI